jgi:hypothetical protein
MKFFAAPVLVLALAVLSALPVQAQDRVAERARIAQERAAADASFAERRRGCNAMFAVNDCLDQATRDRNKVLGELRRQERVLNEADRREKAADRLKAQEERNSAEAQRAAEERRLRALEDQKGRDARAAEKAGKRAADDAEKAARPRRKVTLPGPRQPQGSPRTARGTADNRPTAEEAARNRAAYEARLMEAERHKAEVRERAASRSKPAASSLPVPR